MKIKTIGGHEHPFVYSAVGKMIKDGILATGIRSADDFGSRNVGYGYDPSFHSLYLNEAAWSKLESTTYAGKMLMDYLKEHYPEDIHHKKRILTETPAFIVSTKVLFRDTFPAQEKRKEFLKNAVAYVRDQETSGFSSVFDPYVPHTYIEDLDPSSDEGKDLAEHLTGMLIPWFSFPDMDDASIDTIVKYAKDNSMTLGIKLFTDGSFGAGTAGINNNYNMVTRTEELDPAIKALAENPYLDMIGFHAIGNKAIVDAVKMFEYIVEQTGRSDLRLNLAHLEVVDQTAWRSLEQAVSRYDAQLSPQVNFLPFDMKNYKERYEVFKNKENLCPIASLVRGFGTENITIGTDGMPYSLAYWLTSALMHPDKDERITLREAYSLIRSNQGTKGRAVIFDTDEFERLIRDEKTAARYLTDQKIQKEIDRQIITPCRQE